MSFQIDFVLSFVWALLPFIDMYICFQSLSISFCENFLSILLKQCHSIDIQ